MNEFSKLVKSIQPLGFIARATDAWAARNLKSELLELSDKKALWPRRIKSFHWIGNMQTSITNDNPFGHYRMYEITVAGRERPVTLHFIPAEDNALYFLKGRPAFKKELDNARHAFGKAYKAQVTPIALIIKPRKA